MLMGRFSGNLALNIGTFGNVCIAGGIVALPGVLPGRRIPRAKDRGVSSFCQDIPVFLIRLTIRMLEKRRLSASGIKL